MSISAQVDKATNEFLVAADWGLNLKISDECSSSAKCGELLRSILTKLQTNNTTVQMRSLELLQTCMQNNHLIVQTFHQKEFQLNVLNALKVIHDYGVKDKLLNMIRAWGEYFRSKNEFPNYYATYEFLCSNRTSFPGKTDDSVYSSPQASNPVLDSRPVNSKPVIPVIPHQNANPVPLRGFVDPFVGSQSQVPRVIQGQFPPQAHLGYPQVYHQYPPQNVPYSQPPPQFYQQPFVQPVQRVQQAPPSPAITSAMVAELTQTEDMILEILNSIDPRVEDCKNNDIVKELLSNCTKFQSTIDIEKLIEKGMDDNMLNQILLFNDRLVEINQRIEKLHQIFTNPAKHQQEIKPQNNFQLQQEIAINLPGFDPRQNPFIPLKQEAVPPPVVNNPPVKDEFDDFFDQIANREKKAPIASDNLLQFNPNSSPQPAQPLIHSNPVQPISPQPIQPISPQPLQPNLINPIVPMQTQPIQPTPSIQPISPQPLQPNLINPIVPMQTQPMIQPTQPLQPQSLNPSQPISQPSNPYAALSQQFNANPLPAQGVPVQNQFYQANPMQFQPQIVMPNPYPSQNPYQANQPNNQSNPSHYY